MLTFFRRIRKGLLDGGSTSRYLVYAIGEIALVVIGILIALQINNWNEYQKERETEEKVLEEVLENLEANILRLHSMIERCNTDNQSADIILSLIDHRLPYSDSLSRYFALAMNPPDELSFLSYVGYESLKNVGFEIIQDNDLKKEIINLFEGLYLDLKAKYIRAGDQTLEMVSFRRKHFLVRSGSGLGRRFIPLDFDNLMTNKQFDSQLVELKGIRGWIARTLDQCLGETQRVLQLVKDELEDADSR